MTQQRVLVIGAGPAQCRGIIRAKEKGLLVIATDRNPEAPGLAFADVPVVLDVKDVESSMGLAREKRVDGVFSVSSEVSVRTVAAVAEALGLPGLSTRVARIATDKALMRALWAEHGVPSTDFRVVWTVDEAIAACEELRFPVVVKPADNAGSRGVAKVDSPEALGEAFARAKAYSEQGKVMVESFMEGVEASVEAFVDESGTHILCLSDKIRTPPPYLLDTTVIFPSAYPESLQSPIRRVAEGAIEALGISAGPVHIEIMVTPEGPKMVELAARGPGFKVFTEIIPYVTGVDVVDGVIRQALGQRADLTVLSQRASVLKFIGSGPGRVIAIRGVEHAARLHGVHELELYVGPGDRVRPLTSGDDRIGHIITFAEKRDEALRICAEAEARLEIVLGPEDVDESE